MADESTYENELQKKKLNVLMKKAKLKAEMESRTGEDSSQLSRKREGFNKFLHDYWYDTTEGQFKRRRMKA